MWKTKLTASNRGEKLLHWTSGEKLKSLADASKRPWGHISRMPFDKKIYEASISALQASAARVIKGSPVVV